MVSVEQEPARAALDTLRQRTSLLGVCPTQSTLSSPLVSQCVFFAISSLGRDILTFRHSGIRHYGNDSSQQQLCILYLDNYYNPSVESETMKRWGFQLQAGRWWIDLCNKFILADIIMFLCSICCIPNCYVWQQFRVVTACCSLAGVRAHPLTVHGKPCGSEHTITLFYAVPVSHEGSQATWMDSILQPSCLNSTLELSHLPFSQSREPRCIGIGTGGGTGGMCPPGPPSFINCYINCSLLYV